MLENARIIGLILWFIGFVLSIFSGGYKDVHSSYRTLWSLRIMSISVIIYVVASIMNGDITQPYQIVLTIINIIIFIAYAIQEYYTRKIFYYQVIEFLENKK